MKSLGFRSKFRPFRISEMLQKYTNNNLLKELLNRRNQQNSVIVDRALRNRWAAYNSIYRRNTDISKKPVVDAFVCNLFVFLLCHSAFVLRCFGPTAHREHSKKNEASIFWHYSRQDTVWTSAQCIPVMPRSGRGINLSRLPWLHVGSSSTTACSEYSCPGLNLRNNFSSTVTLCCRPCNGGVLEF